MRNGGVIHRPFLEKMASQAMLHVACCMVVNRVLSHSSHFPSRTHLFPIIILSIRTVSADILESGRTLNSQHTCTNVTSPSPGILQLFRFHLSECLVACWEIEPWGYFMVRAFVIKAIQSRGPRPNNMNAGLSCSRGRHDRRTMKEVTDWLCLYSCSRYPERNEWWRTE